MKTGTVKSEKRRSPLPTRPQLDLNKLLDAAATACDACAAIEPRKIGLTRS